MQQVGSSTNEDLTYIAYSDIELVIASVSNDQVTIQNVVT